jgi:hypothetical protein
MSDRDVSDVRRTLRLFNEKAEKLNGLQFLAALRAGKGSYKFEGRVGKPMQVTGDLATVDEVDAFVLTFRLFIQDNESISIRRLAALYAETPELASLTDRVSGIRSKMNGYLDGNSPIVWQKQPVSRRRILDVFLYGGLAHTHRDKTEEYSRWVEHEYMAIPFQSEFYDIVGAVTQTIFWLRLENLEALNIIASAA